MAYLITVFSIVGDLFRDRETSGVVKAIWLLFLFFIPFLTVLIYLIVRGRSMTERQIRTAGQAVQAQENYIRSVAGAHPAEEIATAKRLLEEGTISEAEFATLKAQVLGT
ncbi:MAG: SHOCT domain-containing protein [Micrococcales bacterium]|nr:SHOCT domain-containing protein [Micrococcales bacterium]